MRKNGLWKAVFLVLCVVWVLVSCGRVGEEKESTSGAAGVSFTDALRRQVQLEKAGKTAVLTESLAQAWLLAGGELSAVTEDAEELLAADADMANLGDVKRPSVETIIAEEIDFLILSASIADHVKLYDTLAQAGITTAYFEIETFQDYKAMMGIFTDLTGHKELYEKNVGEPERVIAEQIARADGSTPAVLLLRAYSTGVRAKGSDTMTGQMLSDLGCVNIADSENGLLDNLSMEAIFEADPDYIFVTTMGNSSEAALAMVDELLISNPAWSGLKAVKEGRYFVLNKELFHNKPNNRWGESYQILADILYGEE